LYTLFDQIDNLKLEITDDLLITGLNETIQSNVL